MTAREEVLRLIRYELSGHRIAKQAWKWTPGDPPVGISEVDLYKAMQAYILGLEKSVLFLADKIDELGPVED